ncbi:MAG: hypothetical protein BV456_00715 [Thermoplasmata archaeon M8B2D]|nr:MAG: hypothetical protein BV456_00715 [Thermoplasmata archaeon M8B2D]
MKNSNKKIKKTPLFKVIFALECGGGSVLINGESKNDIEKMLKKTFPDTHEKIKLIEEYVNG